MVSKTLRTYGSRNTKSYSSLKSTLSSSPQRSSPAKKKRAVREADFDDDTDRDELALGSTSSPTQSPAARKRIKGAHSMSQFSSASHLLPKTSKFKLSTTARTMPRGTRNESSLLLSSSSSSSSSSLASTGSKSKAQQKERPQQKTLTQLHFCIDKTIFVSCPKCALSYTKGAPGDETLHRSHCERVQRGMEWGKEEERDSVRAGVEVVESGVGCKNGKRGRIVCFRADVGGKIGNKLNTLLETINLALSAPPISPQALTNSKAYLFLIPSTIPGREKIVGCIIAQRISTALAIAPSSSDGTALSSPTIIITTTTSQNEKNETPAVTEDTPLSVLSKPLPTPLGISRMFTASTHRRAGIALALLDAAARTAIHGCVLNPTRGEIAFTQPTQGGRAVMESWGRGGCRVYEE